MSTQITIRTTDDLVAKFNELAAATDRPRAYHLKQAMQEYIERQAWQIDAIKQALSEADAGDFATDEEVRTLDQKWEYRAD